MLIRQRPEKGLLGGLWEVPSTDWVEGHQGEGDPTSVFQAPMPSSLEWQKLPKPVRHTFTHFHLELDVFVGVGTGRGKPKGEWVAIEALDAYALPTVMMKVVRLVRADAGPLFE